MTSGSQEPTPGGGRPGYTEPWHVGEQSSCPQPYGQPYVPPPGGYAPPPAAATPYVPPRRRRGLGIVGVVLAVFGAVAVLLAFVAFPWYRRIGNDPVFPPAHRSTFGELHQRLELIQDNLRSLPSRSDVHLGVAPDYFSWLGWLLFGVVLALALLAVLPIPGAAIFRVLGLLAGLAGVAFTLWAIVQFRVTGATAQQLGARAPGYVDWISRSYVGAWLALGGFLLLAIAAATGPRRKVV